MGQNQITEVDVIYKPVIHQEIINNLSSSIHESDISISNFTFHAEDRNTIYPTSVEDSDTKFILRLAYDESAIFDSNYCKNRLNVYKLYLQSSENEYITQFYYSSSEDSYNTLTYDITPSNIPDVAIKDISETFNPIDFHKIGHIE